MSKLQISSISIDEKTGSARLVFEFEGDFPSSTECDDPFVELFRPVRVKYGKDVMFTILVNHGADSTVCTLLPSNNNGHSLDELKEMATIALKGDTENAGIISEYRYILERFFESSDGLNLYLEKIEQIKDSIGANKTVLINEVGKNIKAFVAKAGFEMPSLKTQKAKKK